MPNGEGLTPEEVKKGAETFEEVIEKMTPEEEEELTSVEEEALKISKEQKEEKKEE